MGISLTFNARPRPGAVVIGQGKAFGNRGTKWAAELAPLKEHIGETALVLTMPVGNLDEATIRNRAYSKVTGIRKQLWKSTPKDDFAFIVDLIDGKSDHFGIFVTYNGEFSDEQVAEKMAELAEKEQAKKFGPINVTGSEVAPGDDDGVEFPGEPGAAA